jgi:predicted MFS family arabinose efflux permease
MRLKIRNPYRGMRGLPADVWIIFATTLVNRAGMMALPFLVLYLTKSMGVSASLGGLAISFYGIGGLIAAPLAGALADRIGYFAVMRASLASTGLVLLIIPLVHNYWGVVALTLVWAMCNDSARPATMAALTGASSPEQRKVAIAVNRLAVNLGMSVGPAIGGFLALVSFKLLFVVDGLTSLAASAVLTTLLWIRGRKQPVVAQPVAEEPAGETRRASWIVAFRDATMRPFLAALILLNLVFSQHEGAMPLYLVRDLHHKESLYGSLFVINTLMIVAMEVPLNVAMTHWSSRIANTLGVLLIAIGFGGLAFARSVPAIVLTVVFWTFGEMIFFPASTAYVAEVAPAGKTGAYMGAASAAFSLALIVGPWMGTTMLDGFGAFATWTTMFVIAVAAATLLLLSGRRGR